MTASSSPSSCASARATRTLLTSSCACRASSTQRWSRIREICSR